MSYDTASSLCSSDDRQLMLLLLKDKHLIYRLITANNGQIEEKREPRLSPVHTNNNVKATFDFVAFDNVASTLLLVWTGLYFLCSRTNNSAVNPNI